jgi:hypothetical protein
MTSEAQRSKTAGPSKEAQPKVPGLEAVVKVLNALVLLPLHAFAEGRNQSIPSLLHDLTGLSKSRISKGNLDALRPSTQLKIHRHQERLISEHLKDDKQAQEIARLHVAAAPLTKTGSPAPLAGWMHLLDVAPDLKLPVSKAVGLSLDELIERLLEACRRDDLAGFRRILSAHAENHGHAVRVGDAPLVEPATPEELVQLHALGNWDEAADVTKRWVGYFYFDLITTLDAEWSSQYFGGRQTLPLFPLVMVRPQPGLIESGKVSSRKNVYFRPSRRLLEFLYALVFLVRYKRWPSTAPSPRELADILYKPGNTELDGPELVYNYFDGSTKLTLDLVCDHWLQLFHHFMPERVDGEMVRVPLPLVMLALQWQALLIQDKGKSFFVLDLKKYDTLWRHRRQQWDAEQTERDRAAPQAGHTKGEPIVWPAWMLSQSSSSS